MACNQSWTGKGAFFKSQLVDDLVFHQLALILSAICMCFSVSISCWLILDHALHYLKPYEQKQCAPLISQSILQLTC